MTKMKFFTSSTAMIGDLVDSRTHDRAALHTLLTRGLTDLGELNTVAHEPLHPTVGDEIQGIFRCPGDALKASHILRLTLRVNDADIRFGIGIGEIREVDSASGIQDGPGWWAARTALEYTEDLARTSGYGGARTALRTHISSSADPAPAPASITHTLTLIDSLVSSLKPATCASLLGLLQEQSNAETAQALGISASANSQRVLGNNLKPLANTMRALWDLTADGITPQLSSTTDTLENTHAR